MVDINALLPEGMPNWTPEETSGAKEFCNNGELIDWAVWARSPEIMPLDLAKLAHHINPLKWRGYQTSLGELPEEQRYSIDSLAHWLKSHSDKWTLTELVAAVGNGAYAIQLPYGMIQATKPKPAPPGQPIKPPETPMQKEARLSAAQALGIDISIPARHYLTDGFPDTTNAKNIARWQHPLDAANQAKLTNLIETTLNRSNPEFDWPAKYSAADVMGLLEELYQMPSEHIRAWHNATQPPPPIGTAEPDTTPRQERELTQWMRKTWEAEGKPNGSAFFSRLKKYANTKGSPITQHYTVGGKSGGGVGWKTSKTNGERTKASIVNMVSRFKNEDKAKQTGST